MLQWSFMGLIDWYMLQEDGKFIGGYALNFELSYIWPTSSLLRVPRQPATFISRFISTELKINGATAKWLSIPIIILISPFVGLYTNVLASNTNKYCSFQRGIQSRMKYRSRFLMTLVFKFFINNAYILLGLIVAYSNDIHLERQKATRNASYGIIMAIPLHVIGMGLLWLFYHKCHIWKKEGVVVGFKYDFDSTVVTHVDLEGGKYYENPGLEGSWLNGNEKIDQNIDDEHKHEEYDSLLEMVTIKDAEDDANACVADNKEVADNHHENRIVNEQQENDAADDVNVEQKENIEYCNQKEDNEVIDIPTDNENLIM